MNSQKKLVKLSQLGNLLLTKIQENKKLVKKK